MIIVCVRILRGHNACTKDQFIHGHYACTIVCGHNVCTDDQPMGSHTCTKDESYQHDANAKDTFYVDMMHAQRIPLVRCM